MGLLLGFCGGSDSDSSNAIQQSSRNPERTFARLEGSCQSHFVTWADMESGPLYLGTRKDGSAVHVLWTEHPARLRFLFSCIIH